MDILSKIKSAKSIKDIYTIPYNLTKLNKNIDISKVKIVLIVNAVYGNGDLVFCLKIYNYIYKWYKIKCTILSSKPLFFINNGIKNVLGIKIPGKKYQEGANIKKMKIYTVDNKGNFLKLYTPKTKYDIIAFTPFVGTDFEPNKNIAKTFFSYANKFNTFLFSEYNAPEPHKYDFPTGIGKLYKGILLNDVKKTTKKLINRPYVMTYIGTYYTVDPNKCFNNFISYICKKYKDIHKQIDIITPNLILENPKKLNALIKYIKQKRYYDKIEIIKTKEELKHHSNKNERILRFRFDVLPLSYNKYISLFDHCLPDVLLTGDQSVTDVISCCKNYNIFYQIMPWKRDFAHKLNDELHIKNNYLRYTKTSCGYKEMSTKMKSDLKRIQSKYDFRILGKELFDKIIYNIKNTQKNKDIKAFITIVNSSNKKSTIFKKYQAYLKYTYNI